jgi:hypothetical protein
MSYAFLADQSTDLQTKIMSNCDWILGSKIVQIIVQYFFELELYEIVITLEKPMPHFSKMLRELKTRAL